MATPPVVDDAAKTAFNFAGLGIDPDRPVYVPAELPAGEHFDVIWAILCDADEFLLDPMLNRLRYVLDDETIPVEYADVGKLFARLSCLDKIAGDLTETLRRVRQAIEILAARADGDEGWRDVRFGEEWLLLDDHERARRAKAA